MHSCVGYQKCVVHADSLFTGISCRPRRGRACISITAKMSECIAGGRIQVYTLGIQLITGWDMCCTLYPSYLLLYRHFIPHALCPYWLYINIVMVFVMAPIVIELVATISMPEVFPPHLITPQYTYADATMKPNVICF